MSNIGDAKRYDWTRFIRAGIDSMAMTSIERTENAALEMASELYTRRHMSALNVSMQALPFTDGESAYQVYLQALTMMMMPDKTGRVALTARHHQAFLDSFAKALIWLDMARIEEFVRQTPLAELEGFSGALRAFMRRWDIQSWSR